MQEQLDQVRQFHQRSKAPIASAPTILETHGRSAMHLHEDLRTVIEMHATTYDENDVLVQRALTAIEELAAWLWAHDREDLDGAGNAWADRCYALLGDAIASGLPAEALFDTVHRSKMTKPEGDPAAGKKRSRTPQTDFVESSEYVDENGFLHRPTRIGIWWLVRNLAVGKAILPSEVPIIQGVRAPPFDHAELWPLVKEQLELPGESTDYERGRVVLNVVREKLQIFCSKKVHDNKLNHFLIGRRFSLPMSAVVVEVDEQYE